MSTGSLAGQIDLLAIVGARFENGNIIIPSTTPSVFTCETKSGQKKAYLDIVIRESPGAQYGNSHFVKTTVGRSNRDRLGLTKEDVQRNSPIIGNLRPLDAQQQRQQAQQGISEMEDLPEDSFQGF